MRTFSQKGGIADNGLRRSAAVGPATSTKGLTGDVENQHAFAGVRHVAVTGTSTTHAEASPDDVPMDAGTDGVDTQVSVLTFLKIVSTHVQAQYAHDGISNRHELERTARQLVCFCLRVY